MLKWKKVSSGLLPEYTETLVDFLAGAAGKNRRLLKASCTPTQYVHLRIYRDAEQIVDFNTYILSGQPPFIELDIPLAAGQFCKVGFHNATTELAALDIMIMYEETD